MAKLQEKKILKPKPNRLMAKNVADRNTAHGMRNTACGAIKKARVLLTERMRFDEG
jgi:hypothetical protein